MSAVIVTKAIARQTILSPPVLPHTSLMQMVPTTGRFGDLAKIS
jgi:hypothetical protein